MSPAIFTALNTNLTKGPTLITVTKPSKILTLITAIFLSCTGIKPVSFINDDMDLRDYETFRLIVIDSEADDYSIDGLVFFNQVEKNILNEMDKRAFTQSNQPDLIVRYEIISSQRTETSTANNYYNPYLYYVPAYSVSRQVTEGVLLVEFRDRKKKKLVWQASVDLEYKLQESTDIVARAVQKIFSTFPYLAGSYEVIPSLQEQTSVK